MRNIVSCCCELWWMTCCKSLNITVLQLTMGHELRSVSFQQHELSHIPQKWSMICKFQEMHPTKFLTFSFKWTRSEIHIYIRCMIYDKYYINARVWWSMPWWQNKAKKAISLVKNKSIGLERPTNSMSASWASEEMWKTGLRNMKNGSGRNTEFDVWNSHR